MRNLILLFIVFPLLSPTPKLRESLKVKSTIYEIVYSEKLQQPKSVKYTVLCPDGTASRTGMDFYTVDSIKTSDDLDYANNHYDKGHMAPAADFNCTKEMLHLTFSYVNCALQDQDLNRGLWKDLETHERNLAEKDTVDVTILVVFSSKSVVLPTGATVPDGFYKTITLRKSKKYNKYYFPNKKPEKKTIAEYLVKAK
jgi:endonuclease G